MDTLYGILRERFMTVVVILLLAIFLVCPDAISAGMQRSREAMLHWTILQIFSFWWS